MQQEYVTQQAEPHWQKTQAKNTHVSSGDIINSKKLKPLEESTHSSDLVSAIAGQFISYTLTTKTPPEQIYKMKENEWYKLVGKNKFQSLDKELRDFLINAAGMFDFGFQVDIKKAYQYSPYNDEG